jgi:hypothetical protein
MMTLVFQEHQTGKVLMAYIPNQNKALKINPPESIKKLGSELTIGTPVRIDFLGSKFQGASAEGKAPQLEAFIYRGQSQRRVDGKMSIVVKVQKGSVIWMMPLENVGQQPVDEKGRPKDVPTPDPALMAKLETFKDTDIVDIDYTPRNFNMFLTDIRPHVMTVKGKLLSKLSRKVGDKKLEYVVIMTKGGKTYNMQVPYEETKTETGVSAALDKLKLRTQVEATYIRQNAIYHLQAIKEAPPELPDADKILNRPLKL